MKTLLTAFSAVCTIASCAFAQSLNLPTVDHWIHNDGPAEKRGTYVSVRCRGNEVVEMAVFQLADHVHLNNHKDGPKGVLVYPQQSETLYRFYWGADGRFKGFFKPEQHARYLEAMKNGTLAIKRSALLPADQEVRNLAIATCGPKLS